MKKLEDMVSDRQKVDAKATSNLTHKKEALKAEQKKLKEIGKQYDNVGIFYNTR